MSILFFVTVGIALAIVVSANMIISDPGQMTSRAPRAWGLAMLKQRSLLMTASVLMFVVSLVVGAVYQIMTWPLLAVYGAFFAFNFFSGFLAAEMVFFPDQHRTARYRPVNQITELGDDEDVFVIKVGDEAQAFPRSWIVGPHVAGTTIAGHDVAMVYCGLSHLALAYQNDVNGHPLDLKVAAQFENNLVLRDAASGDIIQHIYGEMIKEGYLLDQVPVTTMPYRSFKSLHPDGQVFYNPPRGPVDSAVRKAVQFLLYGQGQQYDQSNPQPVFKTIKHGDDRLPSKSMVYGLDRNGESVAYTIDYLRHHGNVVVEEVGGLTVTIKYFDDCDFVDMFYGDVPDVGPEGARPDGSVAPRVTHANKLMWMIWRNFYPETALRAA